MPQTMWHHSYVGRSECCCCTFAVVLLLLYCCPCQALRRASLYRVPLYVTETGISIASNRERHYTIDAYMKEVCVCGGGGCP